MDAEPTVLLYNRSGNPESGRVLGRKPKRCARAHAVPDRLQVRIQRDIGLWQGSTPILQLERRRLGFPGSSREEVHEVLENVEHPPVWLRRPGKGGSPFYVVPGRTAAGRYLTIPGISVSEPPLRDDFMPATAGDTDEAERQLYQRHRG